MSQFPLHPHVDCPANPPALPIRGPEDRGGPEIVVRASAASTAHDSVTLAAVTQHDTALTVTLRVVGPGMVRVVLAGEEPQPNRVQLARPLDTDSLPVTITQAEGQITISAPDIEARVTLEPFGITFLRPDGRVLLQQAYSADDTIDRLRSLPFGFSVVDGERAAFHDTFTAEPDEHFYGFGEKFTNFDKRGQRLVMWNYDALGGINEHAYKNVPFFVSTRGYGVFVDSIMPVEFDMAASHVEAFSVIVPDSALDYTVIAAPDLKTVVTRYADLVGYPPLPPKWSLGLWMSSGFEADNADDVLARARQLREDGIPCDVMHLDCYWQKHGSWSDMQWDTAMFPDPAGLIADLHTLGFRVCLWMNSYIGEESPLFAEAAEHGYFLKNTDGTPWIGDLWGGHGFHPPVGIIDLTNPDAVAWFAGLIRPLLEMGVDVFKTDFGEAIPPETIAHNGMTGVELHNLYTLLYNDLVFNLTSEATGRDGIIWGRSTYAGGQRYGPQWGGDINCTYGGLAATLRGGLSMAMVGHACWSHDIGGFHRTPTPELFVRWTQFGMLSPFARAHGMSTRLPWDYGEEAQRHFTAVTRLRYRLLPYLYTAASHAHDTGLPMIYPMVLAYPDDPNTYGLDLQYKLGDDLLVAPIYNSTGRRSVYFPAGSWIDYWTHENITGPTTREIVAALDTIPLYVRAGTLLPTIEPPDHIDDGPFKWVVFEGYLLDQGEFTLHDTDGKTRLGAALIGTTLEIEVEGAKPRLGLRLLPLTDRRVEQVTVNGTSLPKQITPAFEPDAPTGWATDPAGALLVVVAVG